VAEIRMQRDDAAMLDVLGEKILRGDLVVVVGRRCGMEYEAKGLVVRVKHRRAFVADTEGRRWNIRSGDLVVLRRDGEPGYEGNRPFDQVRGKR